MRVSVFGLGYVGCISAACLADNKHRVTGVDSDREKVLRINRGISTILEPEIPEIVTRVVQKKYLTATTDANEAVQNSDVSLICVGTPVGENGSIDLSHLEAVCREIGSALRRKRGRHLVAVRSTATPGTCEKVTIPTLEKYSQRKLGRDFGICVNPEFMREGSSVKDFYNPPFTIVGGNDLEASAGMKELYWFIKSPFLQTTIGVAETVKIVCNAFHGLKVGFANEIGNFCQAFGVDSHEVMNIVCQDKQLNISSKYLMPGFAFGGSCLPKDLSALLYEAKQRDLETPILRSILPSNQLQICKAMNMIRATGHKKVGLLGLAFKEGSDDLRQSPMVQLAEMLIGKGYEVRIYDPFVRLSKIRGSNRRYIQREIPHLSTLMTSSLASVFRFADVVLLGQNNPEWRAFADSLRPEQVIIDLIRVDKTENLNGAYRGICW
jgi:GDP-mannose 6-dehydrogenase